MSVEKRTVYFIMVDRPFAGPTRVGKAYGSRKAAQEWVKFVRGAWRGLRIYLKAAKLTLVDGKLDARSIELLDKVFNMDPPAAAEAATSAKDTP